MENKYLTQMAADKTNWHGRHPPFCPNEKEVAFYKDLIGESRPVYLLGMTKELMNLCDVAVDLSPVESEKPTLKLNWFDLRDISVGCIIGDGVINLTGYSLVNHLSKISNSFVCRIFTEKLEGMKYATFFPKEFPESHQIILTQPGIVMIKWEFDNFKTI